MANQKHLTQDDRFRIHAMLEQRESFRAIGRELDKDCTTISKEIRSHLVYEKTGCMGKAYNSCTHRFDCDRRLICTPCTSRRNTHFCHFCKNCNSKCPDYEQQHCPKPGRAPYVCNGCTDLRKCTLEKHFYHPVSAQQEYQSVLSESRQGISLTEAEVEHLDSVISPLIMKGQSINHICTTNRDSITVSESTIYRLVDYNVFTAKNIDLPRKVRYAKRKVKKHLKVDKSCRINRTYDDFNKFISSHPDLPVIEIDSVEGKKGGKVLLTIHFVKAEFMLAFLRNANDSQSVIDIFERLYWELRPDVFIRIMPVLLGDNGTEFSNPSAIEFDKEGNRRTHMFYCDASAPQQKGSAERNHEFIRLFIPKGASMDELTQADVQTMMNHINSICRKSLGNKCPYDMMEFLYGESVMGLLGCKKIPAQDVTLNRSVFKTAGF